MDPSDAPRSKVVGEKSRGEEGEEMEVDLDAAEGIEGGMKRVKMRDLDSVLRSEGNRTLCSENTKGKGRLDQLGLGRAAGTSHTLKANRLSDGFQPTISRCSLLSPVGDVADQNSGHDSAQPTQDMVSDAKLAQDIDTYWLSAKMDNGHEFKRHAIPVLGLDLNVVDASHTEDYNPFYPYKKLDQVRPTDPSECGSTTGPLEENVSLQRWNAMKQNGFLSLNHGGIPLPKQRGRQTKKRKEDALKKRMEIAKREQAKKVAKVVGPSGLLSGLNPGIINHVRNSKQVLSIIAAMVKSETLERQKNEKLSRKDEERVDGKTDLKNTHNSVASGPCLSPQNPDFSSKHHSHCDTSGINKDEEVLSHESNISIYFTSGQSDDLTLKLSAMGGVASQSASQTSNDDNPASQETIAFLSLKGANVASQWLELLRQDIKGRLAALRRSRKRVRNAIQTELPFLLSKGHIYNQENNTHLVQSSDVDATLEMHMVRWKVLFNQMDKELSEEGKHLEAWLEQVTEMLAQCDRSLKSVNSDGLTSVGSSDNTRFRRAGAFDGESAVRAAAASIYSTCTLAMSKENVACFC